MKYILVEWEHELEDEPYQIYSELDGDRRETRRVEFYRSGVTFSYGAERGNKEALSTMPEAPPEGGTIREISPGLFYEIWNQAQERPDGFMGMFF